MVDVSKLVKKSLSNLTPYVHGGNVWEFNETLVGSNRGGTAGGYSYYLLSTGRYDFHGPDDEGSSMGFRVASIPEPATVLFLGLGGLALIRKRKVS